MPTCGKRSKQRPASSSRIWPEIPWGVEVSIGDRVSLRFDRGRPLRTVTVVGSGRGSVDTIQVPRVGY
jgi:hypothetical protein